MPRHKRNRSSQQKVAIQPVIARSRLYSLVGLALIFLATCVAYLPAMNGGVLWDDDAHLTKPELQSLSGLYRIWFEPGATQQYYPLLHSAFWSEHALWGDSVRGYHVVTLVWHLISVSLVYFILVRLNIPGALLVAAIFALHPVMVESVAWITEQKNTLSAVFYLSALLMYLAFDASRRRAYYFGALSLFALGLLTKTVTATLPAALLVIFWWQRGKLSWRSDVRPLIPFFVLGAIGGIVTAWVERTLIGAQGADFELTFIQRGLLAGRVVWFYLGKLLWPANLMFVYPRWNIDPSQWWQWIFPIATLVVLIGLWAMRRRWRGPLAAALYFCGTLVPVLGFLNVYPFLYSFVADHFQYLASLGIIVLVTAGAVQLLARLPQTARAAGNAFCWLLVGILAVLTWRQSHLYSDPVSLYQATIDRNPGSSMAHNNLGMAYAEGGNADVAIEHFRAAVALNARNAAAHSNLGIAIADRGQLPEAIEQCRAAVALKADDPQFLDNLANTLARSGQFQEARKHAEHSLQVRPGRAGAYYNLGVALAGTGDFEGAIAQFGEAVRLRPDVAIVHSKLGELLLQAGRPQQAIEHCVAAVRLQPNSVSGYLNLAQALMKLNRSDEAIAAARRGIDVARAIGRLADAQQIEEWLQHNGVK
jgi:protein O-mannosyl-transferase